MSDQESRFVTLVKKIFEKYDETSKGGLNKEEFGKVMKRLDETLDRKASSEEWVEKYFSTTVQNEDRKLTVEQIMSLWRNGNAHKCCSSEQAYEWLMNGMGLG